jgi:hypothetical protein
MDRFEEMFGTDKCGNTVKDVVVGEDRAQELLLGLDIVRQSLFPGRRFAHRPDRCNVRHVCPPFGYRVCAIALAQGNVEIAVDRLWIRLEAQDIGAGGAGLSID